jgi:signal transduction histidine kinase
MDKIMENGRRRTVLVVDDMLDSVKPILTVLEREGYEALYANNSEEALKIMSEKTPDLILLDLILGEENGFDLLKKIKENENIADVPVLFLSGVGRVDDKVMGLNLGANDFIPKPYHIKELSARIALQIRLKEHERLLKAKNEELARAYEELRIAQAKIVQAEKLATVGQMAAELAHELATPLSFLNSNLKVLVEYLKNFKNYIETIENFIFSLQLDANSPLKEQIEEIAGIRSQLNIEALKQDMWSLTIDCLDGAQFMAKIAGSLQDFSKDEHEDKVPTDLNSLIERVVALARNECPAAIAIKTELSPLPPFSCISTRITQMLLNIIMNAIHAMEKRNGTIFIRSKMADGKIQIAVEDAGCGMKPDVMRRIFEPFFSTKPSSKGTGLGLTIAQKIAAFHGGQIFVNSTEGKGTVVSIEFPLTGCN